MSNLQEALINSGLVIKPEVKARPPKRTRSKELISWRRPDDWLENAARLYDKLNDSDGDLM
jgi:hypothetical protein